MKITNTMSRIFSSFVMVLCLAAMVIWSKTIYVFGGIILLGMLFEWMKLFYDKVNKHYIMMLMGLFWFCLLVLSFIVVVKVPYLLFWLLTIIVATDIGGWLFGKCFTTDKLWERLSPNKTWGGQIFGVLMGMLFGGFIIFALTEFESFVFFIIGCIFAGTFSLFSQYGDLTMSWVKRKFNLKDFSNLIPGHGGFLDRFDGWIYNLPIMAIFIIMATNLMSHLILN